MGHPSDDGLSSRFQTAVISDTGKARSVPSYSIHFEEIGEAAVNGVSIQIHGCSRESAIRWLRSAADMLEGGQSLSIKGFVVEHG